MAEEQVRRGGGARGVVVVVVATAPLAPLDVGEKGRQRNPQRLPSPATTATRRRKRRVDLRGRDEAAGADAPGAADLGLDPLAGRERRREADDRRRSVNAVVGVAIETAAPSSSCFSLLFLLLFVLALLFPVRERSLPQLLPRRAVAEAGGAPGAAEALVAQAGGGGEGEGGA